MKKKPDYTFRSIEPVTASIPEVHKLLLGGIAPRPIALVSTISSDGINNLSPFSFFNAFGANPPTVAFSPARRGRDGSKKDTLTNLEQSKECVIQAVTHEIVQQVSLASTEYESGIDEFIKSGLTPIDSDLIKPKRVKESPFQMECKVTNIIPLGEANASGNMIICEVVKFHVADTIMINGIIEPELIQLVGRNSANYYTKAFGSAIFEIEKPIATKGIGIDKLPGYIKHSELLTGNNLGQLGNIESLPEKSAVITFLETFSNINVNETDISKIISQNDYQKLYLAGFVLSKSDEGKAKELIELSAQKALEVNEISFAINALVSQSILFETGDA